VIVSFGTATLVLRDSADVTLGHWALAGVRALRREGEGMLYAMTPDGYETLEIRDAAMIAAIDAVTSADRGFEVAQETPRRGWLAALAVVLLVSGLAYAVPPALREQTLRMVPPEVAVRFGDEMLLHLLERGGPLCADPAGSTALTRLAELALGPEAPRLRLLDIPAPVALLPGGLVLLDRDLPARAETEDELAGWLVLAETAGQETPPVEALVGGMGPLARLRYILTGEIRAPVIADVAERAVAVLPPVEAGELARRLAEAGVPADGLAQGLRRAGEAELAALLLAAAPGAEARSVPLPEGDWQAIRGVCR
jgi:hypothetical protein